MCENSYAKSEPAHQRTVEASRRGRAEQGGRGSRRHWPLGRGASLPGEGMVCAYRGRVYFVYFDVSTLKPGHSAKCWKSNVRAQALYRTTATGTSYVYPRGSLGPGSARRLHRPARSALRLERPWRWSRSFIKEQRETGRRNSPKVTDGRAGGTQV